MSINGYFGRYVGSYFRNYFPSSAVAVKVGYFGRYVGSYFKNYFPGGVAAAAGGGIAGTGATTAGATAAGYPVPRLTGTGATTVGATAAGQPVPRLTGTGATTADATADVGLVSANVTINFRETADYVTDGANQSYAMEYTTPRSLNGYTWAWVESPAARNRNASSTFAPELSGINYFDWPATHDLLVTLPNTGPYKIGIALGDASYSHWGMTCKIYDDTNLLSAVCTNANVDAAHFIDINGVSRTAAEWKAERSVVQYSFTTTTLRVQLDGSIGQTCIASLIVQQSYSATPSIAGTGNTTTGATVAGRPVPWLIGTGDTTADASVSAGYPVPRFIGTGATTAGATVAEYPVSLLTGTGATTTGATSVVGSILANVTINFRDTADYVTDAANQSYATGYTSPRSLNGYTWHWVESPASRDRDASSTFAPELAGTCFFDWPATHDFIVTLPNAGLYNVGIALGDASWSHWGMTCQIYDDTTLLATVCTNASVSTANFIDIHGVARSAAQWKAERSVAQYNFTTTTLRLNLDGANGQTCIASLIVQQLGDLPTPRLAGTGVTMADAAVSAGYPVPQLAGTGDTTADATAAGYPVPLLTGTGATTANASVASYALAGVTINFRATGNFVTDATNQSYATDDTSSRSLNSYAWHWVEAPAARDRSTLSTFAPELAGICYFDWPATHDFVVTLPSAGSYNVGIALGDAIYGHWGMTCQIYDNTNLLATVCTNASVSAANFIDIHGVARSATQWKAERSVVQYDFATTTLRLRLDGSSGQTCIASLIVQQVAFTPVATLAGTGATTSGGVLGGIGSFGPGGGGEGDFFGSYIGPYLSEFFAASETTTEEVGGNYFGPYFGLRLANYFALGALTPAVELTGTGTTTAVASVALVPIPQLAGIGWTTTAAPDSLIPIPQLVGTGATTTAESGNLIPLPWLIGTGVTTAAASVVLAPIPQLAGTGITAELVSSSLATIPFLAGTGETTADTSGALAPVPWLAGTGETTADTSGALAPVPWLAGTGDTTADASGALAPLPWLVGTGDTTTDAIAAGYPVPWLTGTGDTATTGILGGYTSSPPQVFGLGESATDATATLMPISVLAGTGDTTTDATAAGSLVSALAGTGDTTAGASMDFVGSVAPLAGTGDTIAEGSISLAPVPLLVGIGETTHDGSSTLVAVPNTTGLGTTTADAIASLVPIPLLAGVGIAATDAAAALVPVPILVGTGIATADASVSLTLSPDLAGTGVTTTDAVVSLTSYPSPVGTGSTQTGATVDLIPIPTLDGTGDANSSAAVNVTLAKVPPTTGFRSTATRRAGWPDSTRTTATAT